MWQSQYTEMDGYFPKSYKPFGTDINVKLDLLNYPTKDDLKKQQESIRLN